MITNEIRIMRGPNMWSRSHHRLIIIKYNHSAISEITLEKQSLIRDYFRSHYNFESSYDEFAPYLLDYTLHVASILQGSSVYHHIALPTPGIFYGVLEYEIEEAGLESLKLASEIIKSLCDSEIPITFSDAQQQVKAIRLNYSEGPTTAMIIEAARKRNIPVSKGPAGFTSWGTEKTKKGSALLFLNILPALP